jgi:hypothetical protein
VADGKGIPVLSVRCRKETSREVSASQRSGTDAMERAGIFAGPFLIQVEVLRRTLLEPEPVLLGRAFEELRRLL